MSSCTADHHLKPIERACSRCGGYTCHACQARLERAEPLCAACDEALIDKSAPGVRQATLLLVIALLVDLTTTSGLALASYVDLPFAEPASNLWHYVVLALAYYWYRTSNDALRSRGFELEFGRHAWLYHLVPFANLFLPYRVMRELYERTVVDAGVEVIAWWTLHVLAVLGSIVLRIAQADDLWPWHTVQLLQAAESATFLWVALRTSKALTLPIRPAVLVPLAHVEREGLFADFR